MCETYYHISNDFFKPTLALFINVENKNIHTEERHIKWQQFFLLFYKLHFSTGKKFWGFSETFFFKHLFCRILADCVYTSHRITKTFQLSSGPKECMHNKQRKHAVEKNPGKQVIVKTIILLKFKVGTLNKHSHSF